MSKPVVKTRNLSGNVYVVFSAINRALKAQPGKFAEFRKRVDDECNSYDEVLRLAMQYVDFE